MSTYLLNMQIFICSIFSKHAFDLINAYILPKRELERTVLTVNTLNIKIVGYPAKIDHEKYARNAFYFNICFVTDHYCRSVQYEPIVKKLSEFLIMMEMEYSFLSKDEHRPRIQSMLNKIITDLNETRMCTITEEETTVHLKIAKICDDPPEVYDYQVPILKPEFQKNISIDSWDLTTQQVLPFINNVYHVSKIAALADVENALVKSCIQNLVYYNVIELLPLFKYSNVYMCTRNLQKLARNHEFAQECLHYVALKDEVTLPSLYTVFQLYSQMTHGVTLKTLCIRLSPRQNNINERKLVEFGLKHGLLRCINKFPVFTGSIPNMRQRLYNGSNHFDEICCITGLSAQKLEELIDADTNVTVLMK
jgi:nitrogen permease regulator 2-like protein